MIILGLTGSIGMGKSTTASYFKAAGAAVYDADAAVHALYEKGGAAVAPLSAAFEGVVVNGAVDRDLLRAAVLDNSDAFNRLNQIVHPLVGQSELAFRQQAESEGKKVVVLDIPLLMENDNEGRCDYVAVVTASAETQMARVLKRPGMTLEAFEAILARQVPDSEKRARADFIISTEYGHDFAKAQVAAIMDLLSKRADTPKQVDDIGGSGSEL